jgi:hypothetical protein
VRLFSPFRHRVPFNWKQADPTARALANFYSHITIRDDGCWIWTGGTARKRHGIRRPKMHYGIRRRNTISPARFILSICDGVPLADREGYEACHGCRDELCVNPRHLRWGTRGENESEKAKCSGHECRDRKIGRRNLIAQAAPCPMSVLVKGDHRLCSCCRTCRAVCAGKAEKRRIS